MLANDLSASSSILNARLLEWRFSDRKDRLVEQVVLAQ